MVDVVFAMDPYKVRTREIALGCTNSNIVSYIQLTQTWSKYETAFS